MIKQNANRRSHSKSPSVPLDPRLFTNRQNRYCECCQEVKHQSDLRIQTPMTNAVTIDSHPKTGKASFTPGRIKPNSNLNVVRYETIASASQGVRLEPL